MQVDKVISEMKLKLQFLVFGLMNFGQGLSCTSINCFHFISFHNLIHFKENSINVNQRKLVRKKKETKESLDFSKFFQLAIRKENVP